MPERSNRAVEIMRSTLPEERQVSRVHVTLPATVNSPSLNCHNRLAIVRDLSTSGAFFYSELDAKVGAKISVQFVLSAFGKNIRMVCEGTIIRVEDFPQGAATGVAVSFHRCNMVAAEPA
jgi:hypothetical protein